MSPLDLLERCRQAGIVLTVDAGRLAYDAPTGALTLDLLGHLQANREQLVEVIAGTDPERRSWPCPRCGEGTSALYGFDPDVSCRRCHTATTRRGLPTFRSNRSAETAISSCPACGSAGPFPPCCPGCGTVTAHPPSLDHETGPAWWCGGCLRAPISRARNPTSRPGTERGGAGT